MRDGGIRGVPRGATSHPSVFVQPLKHVVRPIGAVQLRSNLVALISVSSVRRPNLKTQSPCAYPRVSLVRRPICLPRRPSVCHPHLCIVHCTEGLNLGILSRGHPRIQSVCLPN